MSSFNIVRIRQQCSSYRNIGGIFAGMLLVGIFMMPNHAFAQTWGSNNQANRGGHTGHQSGATIYIDKDGLNTPHKSLDGPVPSVKSNGYRNTNPIDYNPVHTPIGKRKTPRNDRYNANARSLDALTPAENPGETIKSVGTTTYGGRVHTVTGTSTLSEDGRILFKGGVSNSPGEEPAIKGSFRYNFSD